MKTIPWDGATLSSLDIERYWAKVIQGEGCWGWSASKSRGYAQINVGGRRFTNTRAHRVSWVIHNGPIPAGKCVLHKCDNPECSNPAHLFLGTKRDNSRDMYAKQRCSLQRYPDIYKKRHRKLNVEAVTRIRNEREVSTNEWARRLGVSSSLVKLVRQGKAWQTA